MNSGGPAINTSWIAFLWTQLVYESGGFSSCAQCKVESEKGALFCCVVLCCVVE